MQNQPNQLNQPNKLNRPNKLNQLNQPNKKKYTENITDQIVSKNK